MGYVAIPKRDAEMFPLQAERICPRLFHEAKSRSIGFRKHRASVCLRVSAGESYSTTMEKENTESAFSHSLDSSDRRDSSGHLS